jgi:hypothetical protein
MDKLSSRWDRKLEIATREHEYALQREQRNEPVAKSAVMDPESINKRWDVFISHASEDKDDIARPLAQALRDNGYRVWYDEFALTVGDSLRRSIDHGLTQSDFGVVILSRSFFEKHWPEQELNGLASKEVEGRKVILPVWHKVTAKDVCNFSPMLADRLGVTTDKGLQQVIEQLELALKNASATNM